nr:major facilitator superfamily [Tanacetum cinerariifolium]
MSADVARSHDGDGGGEDRPLLTMYPAVAWVALLTEMQTSTTQEYPSLIDTFFVAHTVNGEFLRDEDRRIYEMRRLEAMGTYTDDEINRLARGGKQRGNIAGVGRFESGGASGSGRCGDEEEGADHQDDEDEDGDGNTRAGISAKKKTPVNFLTDLSDGRSTLRPVDILVAVSRGLNGIGLAIVGPAIQSLVADSTTNENRGVAFGWLQLTSNIAMWLELTGFSHKETAFLMTLFVIGNSVGGLFGGWAGDVLSKRLPNSGRILLSQISSGSGIPLGALLLLGLKDEPSGLNSRFFWVDECVFPTAVEWRTNASKDGMPANGTYSKEAVRVLDTHQMDLFSLIRAPNPTKVKTGSRPRAPHELPLLTLTAPRVIEMDEPAAATDSSGVPSAIERSPLDFAYEAEASGRETAAPEMPP